MALKSEESKEDFQEAENYWHLTQLYNDLATERGQSLNDKEKTYLRGLLCGYSPKGIDAQLHPETQPNGNAIRQILFKLYPTIKKLCKIKISSKNKRIWNLIVPWLEKAGYQKAQLQKITNESETGTASPKATTPTNELDSTLEAIVSNHNFVGREGTFAELDQRYQQGEKVIVIQGMGGVGKTTLAQQYLKYLKSQGFDLVLDCRMVTEKEGIATVESVIEEWFRRDLQEEPGQEFGVMLARLKRQLQTRKVGVLIDNLETALDGSGRFIETHSGYAHLLKVLADSTLQSVTLITSRERLGESIGFEPYLLPSLNQQAWQEFFCSRQINVDTKIMEDMHKAYGGNALAMKLLCEPIKRNGGMESYWRKHQVEDGILIELAVENLVKDQFKRLEKICPEAYRLLCRLGCYRYQDLATVPRDGLSCLMWDVPKNQQPRIIKSLEDSFLLECQQEEYSLHPFIRLEAKDRLINDQDLWNKVNCEAAEYWSKSVEYVETDDQAKIALEAYFHYVQIGELNLAIDVILKQRKNRFIEWENGEYLGQSLYRLGALEKTTTVIENIIQKSEKIDNLSLGQAYYILGSVFILKGKLKEAMEYFYKSEITAKENQCKELTISAGITMGFCWKSMGELELARKKYQQVLEIIGEDSNYRGDTVHCWCFLAFLYSLLNDEESARGFVKLAEIEFPKVAHRTVYRKGSALLYLGTAYKNLRYFEKASEKYKMAEKFAQEANCKQIIAKALNGIAEIEREQEEFEKALSKHKNAIDIAEQIDAKSDLAESYYQQGLTYQKMGDLEESRKNFEKAIKLYQQMDVPKQVEKVQRAMEYGLRA